MSYETVLLDKTDHLATLTLNRPGRLNALNDLMFEELIDALDNVAKDDDVRAMILTGAGRAFCASADVKEEPQGGDRFFSKKTFSEIYEHIRNFPQQVTLGIHHMPKPTIAAVERAGDRRRLRFRPRLRHPHRLRAYEVHERLPPDGPDLKHGDVVVPAPDGRHQQGPSSCSTPQTGLNADDAPEHRRPQQAGARRQPDGRGDGAGTPPSWNARPSPTN